MEISKEASFWNNIYSHFDPVAFNLFGANVHWYGIMYAIALLSAISIAHWIIKKDNLDISKDRLDSYIWWVELGVILGARLGYVLFYDTHTSYYLSHPWQIFNPFAADGTFIGISGMSYHGALAGFIIASIIWCKKNKISFWFMVDIGRKRVFQKGGSFFIKHIRVPIFLTYVPNPFIKSLGLTIFSLTLCCCAPKL